MMKSRATKKQVGENIIFVLAVTIQFATPCKSKQPVVKASDKTKPKSNPMQWSNDLAQSETKDSVEIDIHRDSQSFLELSKQYLNQIRELNRKLNLIIASPKTDTSSSFPKAALIMALGVAGSQAKIEELFSLQRQYSHQS